jgi:TP901 family phage tail tape measure protein
VSDFDLGTAHGEIVIETSDLLLVQRTLQQTGKVLLGIGGVALAGFGMAIKAAANFEKELDTFQAVTNSTAKEMDAVSKKALELGRNSVYGAGQVAAAFRELGKAGVPATDIVNGMGDAIVNLGQAADIALDRAARIAVNTQQTFQLSAKDMSKTVDLLAGAANASTIEVEDLGVSLKYAGSTAHSLGISLEDTITALGLLGRAGIFGSTAGTSLRRILVSLTPVSEKARKEMEKLGLIQKGAGVSAKEHEAALKAEKSTSEQLAKAQSSLAQLQERQAAAAKDSKANAQSPSNVAKVASAQERLASANAALARTQDKISASKPAKTTAEEVSRRNQLAAAQERVAKAQANLVRAQSSVTKGPKQNTAAQVRSQQQLANAQKKVNDAQAKLVDIQKVLKQPVTETSSAFFDQAGKAKSLGEISQILQDHMKGLTQEQKVHSLEVIFGNRAIASAILLARDGKKGFEAFNKEMTKTTAAEIMRKRLDNLSGQLKILKSSLETAFITAGAPAQEPLKNLTKVLIKLVNAFSRLPGPVQQGVVYMTLFFGLVVGGAGAMLFLAAQILKIVRLFMLMKDIMTAVKAMGLLARVAGLLSSAFEALGAIVGAVLGSTVGVVVVVVIALAAAFYLAYRYIKPFHKAVDALWQAFQRGWDKVLDFFRGIPDALSDAAKATGNAAKAVGRFFMGLPGVIGRALAKVPGIIGDALSAAWRAISGFAVNVGKAIAGGVTTGFNAILDFFAKLPYRAGYALGFVIGALIRFGIDAVKALAGFYINANKAILQFFIDLPGHIASATVTVVTALAGFVADSAKAVANFATDVGGKILGFFIDLPGNVWNALGAVAGFLKDKIPEWGGAALELGGAILSNVISGIGDILGKIGEILSKIPGKVLGFVDDVKKAAKKVGGAIYDGIKEGIKDIPGLIKGALEGAVNFLTGLVGKAVDAGKAVGKGVTDGVRDGLDKHSPSAIERDFMDINKTLKKELDTMSKQVLSVHAMRPTGSLALGTAPMNFGGMRTAQFPTPVQSSTKHIDIDINYPPSVTTEESLTSTLNKAAYLGLI